MTQSLEKGSNSKTVAAKRKRKVKPKQIRNPEKTRTSLLGAGIRLFSARGYHGVSMDDVVDQAGCNKRMLYHYYGNKDGLYTEVLRSVFGKLEQAEMQVGEPSDSTESAIRELLERYFHFLQKNPEFVNLLLWENLNQGRFLEDHPNLLSKAPILERMGAILKRGQARGELIATTEIRHLLVLLIGVCFIYFSNRHTLSHSLNLDLSGPKVLKEGLRLAQDVLVSGLIRKVPSESLTD